MIKERTTTLITSLDPKSGKARPEKRQRRRLDKNKASVWLHGNVHRRLLQLCVDLGTSQQQIFEEALDLWLRKHGEPTISELDDRKRK